MKRKNFAESGTYRAFHAVLCGVEIGTPLAIDATHPNERRPRRCKLCSVLRLVALAVVAMKSSISAYANEYPSIPAHACGFIVCRDASPSPNTKYDAIEPIRVATGEIVSLDDPSSPEKTTERYAEAMRKFPNLISCVTNEKLEETPLSQAAIKWIEIKSEIEAAVCLFRLFDAMRSSREIETWLVAAGFPEDQINASSSNTYMLGENSSSIRIRAFRPSHLGPLAGSRLDKFAYRLLSEGTYLNVDLVSNIGVTRVEINWHPVSKK